MANGNSARTSPIGFFNFADSYFVAAKKLNGTRFRTTHPDSPTRFLYHQTLELYLKSFLLLKGESIDSIFGHRLVQLGNRAGKLGLSLELTHKAVFRSFDRLNTVISARYLEVGYYEGVIALEDIDKACTSLRQEIAQHLQSLGNPIFTLQIGERAKA